MFSPLITSTSISCMACVSYWRYSRSLSALQTFLIFPANFSFFFCLPPYPLKPFSISISCWAYVQCWEERRGRVESCIWHYQGKTCQSFWAGPCLWPWEWAATISEEPRMLSHQGKVLDWTAIEGPSWLDLISECPTNCQRTVVRH